MHLGLSPQTHWLLMVSYDVHSWNDLNWGSTPHLHRRTYQTLMVPTPCMPQRPAKTSGGPSAVPAAALGFDAFCWSMFSIKRFCGRVPRIPRIPRSIYQIGGFREVWHVKSDGNLLALRHRCYWVPVPRSKPWRCSRATRTCTPQRTSGSPVWPLDGCFWTVFSAMIIVKVTKSPQFP